MRVRSAYDAMLNGTPRPRSHERWYIWQLSSPCATKNCASQGFEGLALAWAAHSWNTLSYIHHEANCGTRAHKRKRIGLCTAGTHILLEDQRRSSAARAWQNMWQGGSAMSGSAAGFHAVSTSRRSDGWERMRATRAASWSTPLPA